MNLKRAFLIALAACILPGVALAQDDLGTEVRIVVQKSYTDLNQAPVNVKLECNDGFVSQDGMAEVAPGPIGHTFIVTELTPFAPVICTVTEGDMAGYTNTYNAASTAPGNPSDIDDDMCQFVFEGREQPVRNSGTGSAKTEDGHVGENAIEMGRLNNCLVVNDAAPVEVKVSKDWDVTNSGGNVVDMYAEINVFARGRLYDGHRCSRPPGGRGWCQTLTFIGENPADQTITVKPRFGGVNVRFRETDVDSYVETENSCDNFLTIHPGDTGESCAFVNSVFFEGIPTLSQYGMAIMALLMLGVGFVGFRRFV